MSPDRHYCVLIRDHASLYIEGKGWRDSNYPPKINETGRAMLNFYKKISDEGPGFWFKVFIPNSVIISGLKDVDGKYCEITTGAEQWQIYYKKLKGLMWDVMTGHAQSEEDIENTFKIALTP